MVAKLLNGANNTDGVLKGPKYGSQTEDTKRFDEPLARPIEKAHYKISWLLAPIRPLRNCASFNLGMIDLVLISEQAYRLPFRLIS